MCFYSSQTQMTTTGRLHARPETTRTPRGGRCSPCTPAHSQRERMCTGSPQRTHPEARRAGRAAHIKFTFAAPPADKGCGGYPSTWAVKLFSLTHTHTRTRLSRVFPAACVLLQVVPLLLDRGLLRPLAGSTSHAQSDKIRRCYCHALQYGCHCRPAVRLGGWGARMTRCLKRPTGPP